MIKLNIGCGKRNFGEDWIHIDGSNYGPRSCADWCSPSILAAPWVRVWSLAAVCEQD